MKAIIIASTLVFTLGTGSAFAQNCASGTLISQIQIQNLLTSKYACVGTPPTASWNELHSGGSVIDYKLGPTHAVDPSKTVGSYSFSGQAIGAVTYIYLNGGGTYSYNIRNNLGGTLGTGGSGSFSFCGIGGAPNLAVKVQASNC